MDKLKDLFTARAFWAALVGLVLVCGAGMLPGLSENSTEITQAVIVLAAYITGTAIEGSRVSLPPEPIVARLRRLACSRKLWASVVGLVFVCLKQYRPDFPFTEEQLYQIVTLLAAYILGVGISDRRAAG
jgi:hypothetical protein